MKEHIDKFMELFTKLTKEEVDFILAIVNWSDEKKTAFKIAKTIFEAQEEK